MFERGEGGWTERAFLKASNTGANDAFGQALALSADGNTLAVGAPNEASEADAALNAGAVYVGDAIGATSTQATILTIPAGATTAQPFVGPLDVGYPVGVALSLDETQLLVSGLDPATQTDVVVIIDIATKAQTFYTGDADTDLTAFEEPAGLHRARNVNALRRVRSAA